jgi:hypothetical protein
MQLMNLQKHLAIKNLQFAICNSLPAQATVDSHPRSSSQTPTPNPQRLAPNNMISPKIIAEAARLLLVNELSQRQIAERLGISRGTVLAVSRKRRPLNLRRVARAAKPRSKQQRRYVERVTLHAARLPERCPDCRNLVLLPCQICAGRKQRIRYTG